MATRRRRGGDVNPKQGQRPTKTPGKVQAHVGPGDNPKVKAAKANRKPVGR